MSSSAASVTEPPSLVLLSSNRTTDTVGRSSGDAASPGPAADVLLAVVCVTH